MIDGDAVTLGALVAFLQYSQRFFRPISDMSEKFNVLQSAMASSERIFKLLDEPVAISSPAESGAAARRLAAGHIVFDHVWFAYNSRRTASRPGCSGTCRSRSGPAQRLGIVGATGSGKTTLINLLLRFYDVQRGRITHRRRRHPRARSRRTCGGLFSLVLQDVHLFSGTIADNIRLGHAAIDDDAGAAGGARRSTPTRSSSGCRAATRRRSPSAARRCRSGRSSCCRSRARWRSIRAS